MRRFAHNVRLFGNHLGQLKPSEYLSLTAFVALIVFVSAISSWWILLSLPALVLAPFIARGLYDLFHPDPPLPPADVVTSVEGLYRPVYRTFISWQDIRLITLEWSQSGYDDPMFGPHTLDEWVIARSDRTKPNFGVFNSESNRRVLLPAFRQNLPGYKFNYERFDSENGSRIFDLLGGTVQVWERDA